ncbi:MAG: TIGR01777 family oxidoreductase [Sedimentisphaerales bacterium]|nr:TIGR01777 family oxidoreductase [Sedimentisphaerales bacterium]
MHDQTRVERWFPGKVYKGGAMKIVITGATGFIGRALCEYLSGSYEIVALSRNAQKAQEALGGLAQIVQWDGRSPGDWQDRIEGASAIVNLAGENIASGRWTAAKKRAILDSRVDSAAVLVDAVSRASVRPAAFIQASAIGYYGSQGDEAADESSPKGDGFAAEVCARTEEASRRVEDCGIRYAAIRTGVVLGAAGGALPKMIRPFRFFLGGYPGTGDQWLSWIGLEDETAAIEFLIDNQALSGVFNLTAPYPVTARRFAETLGRVLGRRAWLTVPAFALKIGLGQMAEELLLAGCRVVPSRLREAGFEFQWTNLEQTLTSILKGDSK